ncbi:MAG TPA: NAD(P)-binding domain-containing protein, partial [Terriglobia bacterium]
MRTITLLGAGGKMGCRIADNLAKTSYAVRHVEISERGKAALKERGIPVVPLEQGLAGAEIVILALPDNRIGAIVTEVAPQLDRGTMVMALDIAAPLAGVLPKRDDLVYFVAHPCHPSIFEDEETR